MTKIKRRAEYNLFTGKDGQCFFNLAAPNYEIILASEGYTSRAGAENAIESVQENSQIPERFERRIAKNNQPYFVLKAGNGEIIGVSETYSSPQARDKGINAVMKYGATTVIDDQKSDPITITVNNETYKLKVTSLSVAEILELAGLSSEKYDLFQEGANSALPKDKIVTLKDGMTFNAIVCDIKFG